MDQKIAVQLSGTSLLGLAQVFDDLIAGELFLPLKRARSKPRITRRSTTIGALLENIGLRT